MRLPLLTALALAAAPALAEQPPPQPPATPPAGLEAKPEATPEPAPGPAAEPSPTPPAAAPEPSAGPDAEGRTTLTATAETAPATQEGEEPVPRLWRRWFPEPTSAPASPFWWGWSWGWGYYPLYPGPDMKRPQGVEFPAPTPDRIVTTLRLTAGATDHDGSVGTAISVDARHLGFSASVDAIGKDADSGVNPTDGNQTLGWATAHLAWSFLSERNVRVRFELGGSMLSMPQTGAYRDRPYGGTILVGPSGGISGHFGLVGPFGIEGHVRITPTPVLIEDSRLALAFRAGSFAFTAGERRIRVSGDDEDAPKRTGFAGSEVGVAFRF